MKNCVICKKNFTGKRSDIKFCSRNCKVKNRKYKWLRYRKDKCENCGFVPLHMCQLDVDHIDGKKKNNDPSNLQTLCSNCHRLKTYLNKDWEIKH